MSNNETVTIVNRSSRLLHGTWDGKPTDIPPHSELRVSRLEAMAFRFQNPVMGRGTPLEDWSSKSEYLIGIKDEDDCSPIEQTDAPQRWDSMLVNGPNVDVIRPRAVYASEVRAPQPAAADVGFAKP